MAHILDESPVAEEMSLDRQTRDHLATMLGFMETLRLKKRSPVAGAVRYLRRFLDSLERSVPLSPSSERTESETGAIPQAIFVPLRKGSAVTPRRIADIQHMLKYVAPADIDGEFIVLPPGAKVLPAGAPRSFRSPPEMGHPGFIRIFTASAMWAEVWPGFQCRARDIVPTWPLKPDAVSGPLLGSGHVVLEFRLTPPEGSDAATR